MEAKDKDDNDIIVNLIEKRGIEWELLIVDKEIDIVIECFKRAHEWKPDFVAIWNIDFDIPFVMGACDRAGVDPRDIFSDPSVPEAYRYFKYKQGPKKKKMASGKEMPIKPADQWHTVYTPASFYLIDAMCVYRKLRVAAGELPSYGLDYVLGKEGCIRKLKFEEADGLTKLDWHIFMQSNYKIEYIIYNVVDCISMEELDEKTTDLRFAMPLACGCSDFETFKSQPRRTADALHYFALLNGKVFGTTSDEMATELDEKTLSPEGWIVTLPAHLVANNGLKCIEEDPNLRTNIRVHVADLDVSASYPNGGSVFNISKQTTYREPCKIEGVPEIQLRMQGINLSSGHVNAVEICCGLFNMPDMSTMLGAFQKHLAAQQAA
jgi:DNA polymerase elongation subunit (family B)